MRRRRPAPAGRARAGGGALDSLQSSTRQRPYRAEHVTAVVVPQVYTS